MNSKPFERPLIELSHELAFKKAKLIDNEYKLSVADLNDSDRLQFISEFLKLTTNLEVCIQEYLNDACMDRMYAETTRFGGFDE